MGNVRSLGRGLAALLAILPLATATRAGRLGSDRIWDDGQAEVAVYGAHGERYGIARDYQVVVIVVKEAQDSERGVKALEGGIEALKMNTVLSMRTGIYSYHQMLSIFLRRDDLSPLKLAFSSQEWCGTTFKEWRDRGRDSLLETRSYFEGEGDRSFALAVETDLVFEDSLPLVLRDRPGARRLRLVPSQVSNRAEAPTVETAAAEVAPGAVAIELPGGIRMAEQVTVRHSRGRDRLLFDREPPYLCLRWERSSGHVWTLREVRRLPYWKLTRPGDERWLATAP